MKKRRRLIIAFVAAVFILLIFASCKTRIQYVPVESVRTEYKDRLIKDSVHILDSVFIYSKNDTVFFNKYNTVYKDKLRVDTVCRIDTMRIPYPVTEYVEINKLYWWQRTLIGTGLVFIMIMIIIIIKRLK